MSKKEIDQFMKGKAVIQNNELIAEFMEFGFIAGDVNWYCPTNLYAQFDCSFYPDELRFHKSWDWLMPVIEKIVKIMETSHKHTQYDGSYDFYHDLNEMSFLHITISDMYIFIVKFIKWCNKHENS
ncbi:MAG: hypothetical protein WD512_13645 [Candidatus Paceibacterota bacterium]